MPTTNVLGVPHSYELTAPTNSSQVLVFIHGWLLSRSYWQPLIDRLSADYQCLSYDLRGFGESQPCLDRSSAAESGATRSQGSVLASRVGREILGRSSAAQTQEASLWSAPDTVAPQDISNYSLLSYARDLGILLHELNLSNVWLVGHSLGGSIALWGADQLPDRVRGVICLNAGGGIYLKEEFERFRSAGQQLVKMRPRWLCHLPWIDLLFTRANVAKAIARSWARQRLVDFVMADPEAALGTLLDSTTEAEVHRLPQVVARLKQPVYFIAGAADTVMEPKYVRHLASFHPLFSSQGENVFEIADCGHMAMVEQPDGVVERVREILGSKVG